MRVQIINDTSSYHCGCDAVMEVLRSAWPADTDVQVSTGLHTAALTHHNYDVLVANGEGSMHHASGHARNILATLQAAKAQGKQAWLINSVWDGLDPSLADGLDGVWVREQASSDALKGTTAPVRVQPDLSWWAPVPEPRPGPYAGRVVLGDTFHRVKGWTPDLRLQNTTWAEVVQALYGAKVYVTGRHHGVYAACRAGVPFVYLGGNTHKVKGLLQSAGVLGTIPEVVDPRDWQAAARWASVNPEPFAQVRSWLSSYLTPEVPCSPMS